MSETSDNLFLPPLPPPAGSTQDDSAERYIPDSSRITEIESEHRYAIAALLTCGRKVADAACGEGYGSWLLSQHAAEVVGIDRDAATTEAAARRYVRDNLSFKTADVHNLPFGDGEFDAAVSFETIEHLDRQEEFVTELRRVLNSSGLLILSSPNRTAYAANHYGRRKELNTYHVRELEEDEVAALLGKYFKNVRIHRQNSFYNSLATGSGETLYFAKSPSGGTVLRRDLAGAQYSIVLASDAELPPLPPTCRVDAIYHGASGYDEDDEAVVNQFGLRGTAAAAEQRAAAAEQRAAAMEMENRNLRTTADRNAREIAALHNALSELQSSLSYRLTRGPAAAKRKITLALHGFCKKVLHRLPVSPGRRQQLKNLFYTNFGPLFRNTTGYRNWNAVNKLVKQLSSKADNIVKTPPDLPLTSIVIPVYNHLDLTVKCLRSILKSAPRAPYEMIVADDASTEDLSPLRRDFPQLRIVSNAENLGFLRTANHGAAAAQGEYLVFLNNDTEVLPGWLDELATAIYHHPEAGMIGSQLIHFASGKLQESGNLICRDGSIVPLGRGADPATPEYSALRAVDFCSAASVIMRRELFNAVGGFDEAYVPAYYEDPDLALKFAARQYINYVMPLSRVLHHEMASYGSATLDKSVKNREFFLNRWRDCISRALYAAPRDLREKNRDRRPRMLYIDAQTPMPDRGSGCLDAIFFLNYFIRRGYHVSFIGEYTPGFVPKYTPMLQRMGVECVYEPFSSSWDYIQRNGGDFQLVFVSRIYQVQSFSGLLRDCCPGAVRIFNTVDLHYMREKREAELHNSETELRHAAATERTELAAATRADAVIVISAEEKKLLDDRGIDRVFHIPQAREVVGCRMPFEERDGMVFIGSAHPPNLDALKYFTKQILPLVRLKKPGAVLTVIGEALADSLRTMPEYKDVAESDGIKLVGFVEDLGEYLDHAKITVAPLRYGAGTKGKVASSFSYGVPCVSTPCGVEGTGMIDGVEVAVAATPEEFAAAILRLDSDGDWWNRLSVGGMDFLRRNYAPEAVAKEMDRVMDRALGHAKELAAVLPLINSGAELAKAALHADCHPEKSASNKELTEAVDLTATSDGRGAAIADALVDTAGELVFFKLATPDIIRSGDAYFLDFRHAGAKELRFHAASGPDISFVAAARVMPRTDGSEKW